MLGTLKNWSIVLHGTTEDPQPPLTGSRRRLDPGQCKMSLLILVLSRPVYLTLDNVTR